METVDVNRGMRQLGKSKAPCPTVKVNTKSPQRLCSTETLDLRCQGETGKQAEATDDLIISNR